MGETIEVSTITSTHNSAFGSAPLGGFDRSKFADCPAGAVPNSYPKLDLLWDNVIAGPWERPTKVSDSQLPARRFADTAGHLQNARAEVRPISSRRCQKVTL